MGCNTPCRNWSPTNCWRNCIGSAPYDPQHLPGEIKLIEAFRKCKSKNGLAHSPPHLVDWTRSCSRVALARTHPGVCARICDALEFPGNDLEERRNAANESVISKITSRIPVRVIHTDEELMIARSVCRVLDILVNKDNSFKGSEMLIKLSSGKSVTDAAVALQIAAIARQLPAR